MHRSLSSGIMAITTAAILIGSITEVNQLFAAVECKSCITQFQILTRTSGADAGRIILTDNSIPISKFIQLNLQFEKNIIKAVYAGHVNTRNNPVLRDLVSKYGDDLLKLGPPDQVKPLLEAYQAAVFEIIHTVVM